MVVVVVVVTAVIAHGGNGFVVWGCPCRRRRRRRRIIIMIILDWGEYDGKDHGIFQGGSFPKRTTVRCFRMNEWWLLWLLYVSQ